MALCTAFAAQAASAPAAPACMASMTDPAWADCAGAFSDHGHFSSNADEVIGGLTFDGDGAPVSSVDFSALGVSVNANGAGSDRPQASTYGTQPLPAIPEPHTNLLMLAGLAAIGFMATRRRRP